MTASPQVVVLAGPNGAGKSTVAPEVVASHLGIASFVNADVIARGLAGFAPESVDLAAGRIMLARLKELAAAREDFAFETTLSSRSFAPWLGGLCRAGYQLHVYYVWLKSPALAVARVRRRFETGGHTVAEADVLRRYGRSASNFFRLYKPLCQTWRVFDNSEDSGPVVVASGGSGTRDMILVDETWRLFSNVAAQAEANS
jgi:predicted ABC-type ATPase